MVASYRSNGMICILYYIRNINIIINTEFEQDTARTKDKTCEALAVATPLRVQGVLRNTLT